MFLSFKRIFSTAIKDLFRNKAISLSSVSVMSLVFLVFSIFTIFAYGATKFLHYVETREHLEVFFNTNVPEEKILEIKTALESTGKTEYVEYTTQEEAAAFLRQRHSDNPLILGAINPEALPPSLAIRAKKIDYVTELNSSLKNLDPKGELIYKVGYNEDTTNLLKDLLVWIRLIGAGLFSFLIVIIFLVSLITVEMSIAARGQEISIMQLVGGGKWYIRAPFVFGGAIYGILGALISSIIIVALGGVFYLVKDQSPTLSFISNFFSDLDFPKISLPLIFAIIGIEIIAGAVIGSINSLIAVYRRLT
jgi:cell division transport system permease protein